MVKIIAFMSIASDADNLERTLKINLLINKLRLTMQEQHPNASDIMRQCAQYSDRLRYQVANEQVPDHWETLQGDILWIKQVNDSTSDKNRPSISVRLATPHELINNPDIRRGAISLTHQIDHYQQQLKARTMQSLGEEHTPWAPSLSNKVQTEDLAFGQAIERFLYNFNKTHTIEKTIREQLKQWINTLCLAIDEAQITVTESRFIFPTPTIQSFKVRFNRMMERRVRLLNHALACKHHATISYIPLGLEIDCTPKRVSHKLFILNEIEKQSLHTLITEDTHNFANAIANKPHHITELMQPLLSTSALWGTLWPGKEKDIHMHVMIQLQSLRLHAKLADHQPRVAGILRKAEKLIKETLNYPSC